MINVVSTFRRNTGIKRSFFYEKLDLYYKTQTVNPNLVGNNNSYTFFLISSTQTYTDQINPTVASPISKDLEFNSNQIRVFNIVITQYSPNLTDITELVTPDYHFYSSLCYPRSPLVEYLQFSLQNLIDFGLFFPAVLNQKNNLTLTSTQI